MLQERLTWDEANLITEGGGRDNDGQQKSLYMKGIFVQGQRKNQNQRVYPVNEITNAVEYVNQQIKNGETVWGEADHPEGLNINLERISHMITEMWVEGSNGHGKLKIVDTPMGQLCRTLVDCGGKLGVSSRGSGNVNEATGEVSDFEIVTVDIVARPSAPDAYPKAVYEQRKLKNFFDDGKTALREDLAKSVKYDPKAQKYLKNELLNWLDGLRS